ncbi:MAG TPA: PilZ domain-containing protein, partial [Geobacteraceae bacterium]|nr:PilZ domain-containing protein [Geobacteraceae bacterium]
IDLSSRGLFIACSEEVNVEDKVEVSMLVSGRSTDLVEAWGRVAWVNSGTFRKKQKIPAGFGVEFLSIPDESAYLVKRFIEREGAE